LSVVCALRRAWSDCRSVRCAPKQLTIAHEGPVHRSRGTPSSLARDSFIAREGLVYRSRETPPSFARDTAIVREGHCHRSRGTPLSFAWDTVFAREGPGHRLQGRRPFARKRHTIVRKRHRHRLQAKRLSLARDTVILASDRGVGRQRQRPSLASERAVARKRQGHRSQGNRGSLAGNATPPARDPRNARTRQRWRIDARGYHRLEHGGHGSHAGFAGLHRQECLCHKITRGTPLQPPLPSIDWKRFAARSGVRPRAPQRADNRQTTPQAPVGLESPTYVASANVRSAVWMAPFGSSWLEKSVTASTGIGSDL